MSDPRLPAGQREAPELQEQGVQGQKLSGRGVHGYPHTENVCGRELGIQMARKERITRCEQKLLVLLRAQEGHRPVR